MKKTIGIILIIVGFCIAIIAKIGPKNETEWMFAYGIWPLLTVAAICLVPGLMLYNKNK